MGQFKPMVKMFTDEPSVILKLKKGGGVKAAGQAEGFKSMASNTTKTFEGAAEGRAPKKPSMAERQKAMNPNQYKKGGNAHPVKKASGGAIDRAETRTTIEGGAKKFAKTKVDTAHKDKAHGTGAIKEGRPAGYATGGAIPADTKKSVNKGKIVMGGTIEGNEGAYEKTDVHTATKDKAHGTGGIKVSNAGGFKKGGVTRKASGGAIDKKLTRTTVEGGDWENRPANSAKPGVKGTHTGEVKEANAGGFKKGGHAKKAYATGGNVVDDGKAEKMPRHFVSRPVANSLQSGTFKRGGKVKHHADGGSEDLSKGAYDRAVNEKPMGSGFASKIQGAIDNFFGAKPAGSVTKTKESVTVSPKKRGGKAC
jgi:hypothetical protein